MPYKRALFTLAPAVSRSVPWRPHDGRHGPREEDHERGLARGAPRAVRQRPGHREVPVERDHLEIKGRRNGEN